MIMGYRIIRVSATSLIPSQGLGAPFDTARKTQVTLQPFL